MALKERILADLQKAMKAGDRRRLEALRSVRAALVEKEIERRGSGTSMTEDDELGVLTSAAKKRREAIELFEKGGRADLVQEEQTELAVIQEYLPRPLTQAEIEQAIRGSIAATGAAGPGDFGKVMPLVMKELKGKAEGKQVQELVRKLLAGS
jgi:uncharacterized protein YqeY